MFFFVFFHISCSHACDKKDASVGTSDADLKLGSPEQPTPERTFGDDLYLHSIVCIVIVLVSRLRPVFGTSSGSEARALKASLAQWGSISLVGSGSGH